MTYDPFRGYDAWKTRAPEDNCPREDDDNPDNLLERLDAYGHLTWTLGNDDWMACFDAVREGDFIAYHVVVNCESGSFIETTEKGIVPVSEAARLINLPSEYVDAGIENHLSARRDKYPTGRFSHRDCEKRWARHIKQLINGK